LIFLHRRNIKNRKILYRWLFELYPGPLCRKETRTFNLNPIAMVLADRGKYVVAALTVGRAYRASGERVSCSPLGSYGEWSRVVREPLIWLGETDPVSSMEGAREEDPERQSETALIELIKGGIGNIRIDVDFTLADLIARAMEAGMGNSWDSRAHPELYALLVEKAGTARRDDIDARRLGNWFKRIQGKVRRDHKIVKVADQTGRRAALWKCVSSRPNGAGV
jgi:putative DNA primase/helicase